MHKSKFRNLSKSKNLIKIQSISIIKKLNFLIFNIRITFINLSQITTQRLIF